jgi:hypothetical protein
VCCEKVVGEEAALRDGDELGEGDDSALADDGLWVNQKRREDEGVGSVLRWKGVRGSASGGLRMGRVLARASRGANDSRDEMYLMQIM